MSNFAIVSEGPNGTAYLTGFANATDDPNEAEVFPTEAEAQAHLNQVGGFAEWKNATVVELN